MRIELRIIGLGILIAGYISFMIIFFMAYFNNYETLVQVNEFHEAHVEAIFFSIGFIFTCLYVIDELRIMRIDQHDA